MSTHTTKPQSCPGADPGKRKGGAKSIERKARGNAHFWCSAVRLGKIPFSARGSPIFLRLQNYEQSTILTSDLHATGSQAFYHS